MPQNFRSSRSALYFRAFIYSRVRLCPKGWGTRPPNPTGLTAIANIGNISLSWNASTGATSYKVYRKLPADRKYLLKATVSVTNYTDGTVIAGNTYQYVVSALNSAGESATSSSVSVLALAGLPQGANPAITYENAGTNNGIFVMDANGANVVKVSATGDYPSWSPASQKIAYVDQGNLLVMNRDGTGKVSIATNVSLSYAPAWSPVPAPDGRYKIAYTASAESDRWVVNPDGTGSRQLTFTSNELYTGHLESVCSWSPDATRIVFGCWHDLVAAPYLQNCLEVITVGVSGGNLVETSRTTLIQDLTGDMLFYSVDWCRLGNPDRVAVSVMSFTASRQTIYTMDVANPSSFAKLLPSWTAEIMSPSWSPDDSQIVFSTYTTIYKAGADGSNPVAIGSGTSPCWRRNP